MPCGVVCNFAKREDGKERVMTKEEAIYILRNTAFLVPSLEPIDEAIEMACEALRQAEPQTEGADDE